MKNFTSRLREARGIFTQKQAADMVGCKQQNWARYESGQVLPGAETLHKICTSFGVSADWLLGLKGNDGAAVTATNSTVAAFGGAVSGGDCSRCPLMLAAREALAPKAAAKGARRGGRSAG